MSITICLAPAQTIAYPHGGGHLWVYLQWALGLRALGFRVIWLEGVDPRDPEHDPREMVTTLKSRLEPYGFAPSLSPLSLENETLPPDVAEPARAGSGAPYTTVAHWWGGSVRFGGDRFSNDKRAGFLEYAQLPGHTPVTLELAVCLGHVYEEWRARLEPLGWKLREAWTVSTTPEQYRAYIQRSRGEFSCAKPTYVKLATGWISDRTICYLASGKPAVVQHTGSSRYLPYADGLFRFKTMDEAVRALAQVESDYERHCRLARALAEEYFDARRVVGRVLEQALAERVGHPA